MVAEEEGREELSLAEIAKKEGENLLPDFS
jgi:hypothetical protein